MLVCSTFFGGNRDGFTLVVNDGRKRSKEEGIEVHVLVDCATHCPDGWLSSVTLPFARYRSR